MEMKSKLEVLQKLLSNVSKFYIESRKVETERWERGESFNIFNTLGLKSEEVRLHSAFIGELLNPNGSHGASSLFLKAFLQVIGIDEDYINCEACSANILERVIGTVTETEGGRIDVIVEDGNHAVIIENKIYAADRCNQLLRYHNYGDKNFPAGYKLLYLTLYGHEPSDCSIGDCTFNYSCLSYDSDVLLWLDKCLELVPRDLPVREVIRQYSDLVKQLTYKDMDTKYIDNLKSIALAPENVLAVGELFKVQNEWTNSLIETYILNPLCEYARLKGLAVRIENYGICIYREEWKYYAVYVYTDNPPKGKRYMGVSYYKENIPDGCNKLSPKERALNSLNEKPNDYWPYGWEYLPSSICSWDYHITEQIVNGEVVNWIMNKFDEILNELEERNLRMP